MIGGNISKKVGALLLSGKETLGFRDGVGFTVSSIAYLLARPRFVAYCLAPWLINLLIVMPLAYLAIKTWGYDNLAQLFTPTVWWQEALNAAYLFVLWIALFAATLLTFLLGSVVIGAPFHDKLGELIEHEELRATPHLIVPPDAMSIPQGIAHAVWEAIRRVSIALPILILVLCLGVIPVVGPLVSLLVNGMVTALFLTLDSFSMPMDRRGITMKEKLGWVRRNLRFSLGFGLPFMAIPCAFFIAPPLASVAASWAYSKWLIEMDRLSPDGGPPQLNPQNNEKTERLD